MGRQNYRRASPAPVPVGLTEPGSDPYAAYLDWIARGRPSMAGGDAVRPEASTVLLTEHVQMQVHELAGGSEFGGPIAASKPSAWQRLVGAFRRS
ncbi:hypothetical protein N1028_19235 [Herbiconiux sp. CPCC 203407]|uniref:Uncharacterized protein n=1 Tax=Herbiconiux oxytropis TaxID=2970915 RepID=A0AA41XH05_9MICO|nr:hypothetical protein [Herbiconiux oxytropis]MCS5723957.1 hypothetical protein [Herbiconiux oxytropis]MCS5728037.1 hypothetical protein [Herbiconiux oxytropis]